MILLSWNPVAKLGIFSAEEQAESVPIPKCPACYRTQIGIEEILEVRRKREEEQRERGTIVILRNAEILQKFPVQMHARLLSRGVQYKWRWTASWEHTQ